MKISQRRKTVRAYAPILAGSSDIWLACKTSFWRETSCSKESGRLEILLYLLKSVVTPKSQTQLTRKKESVILEKTPNGHLWRIKHLNPGPRFPRIACDRRWLVEGLKGICQERQYFFHLQLVSRTPLAIGKSRDYNGLACLACVSHAKGKI